MHRYFRCCPLAVPSLSQIDQIDIYICAEYSGASVSFPPQPATAEVGQPPPCTHQLLNPPHPPHTHTPRPTWVSCALRSFAFPSHSTFTASSLSASTSLHSSSLELSLVSSSRTRPSSSSTLLSWDTSLLVESVEAWLSWGTVLWSGGIPVVKGGGGGDGEKKFL